jgi:hypothetical protein
MARMHIHVTVDDLAHNVAFYSAMFGADPSVLKDDYAKWQLDDPRVNFAISTVGTRSGLDHLGIQADDDAELQQLRARLDAADIAGHDQQGITCCYARSDKTWSVDPQGIAWEAFHSLGSAPIYGESRKTADGEAACCTPELSARDSCC